MNLNQGPSTYQPNALPLGQTSSPLPLITLGPFLILLAVFTNKYNSVCICEEGTSVCVHACMCVHVGAHVSVLVFAPFS